MSDGPLSLATPFGPFEWRDPCWESEPLPVALFDEATLTVRLYDRKPEGTLFTAAEEAALARFLALSPSRRAEIVPHLWQYYREVWDCVGPPDVVEIADAATIWDHVEPRSVRLATDEDGVIYVDVEAECDWEPEHGLQLVLQNGDRWLRVSSYSGHLTEGRAFGRPELDRWMADPALALPVHTLDDKLGGARR